MRRPALFIGLFDLLWTLDALFPKAEAELKDLIDQGPIAEVCAILIRPARSAAGRRGPCSGA